MTKSELNQKLSDSLQSFSEELHSMYKEGSNTPVTEDDLHVLARNVFYALDDFRKFILEYLD